MAYSTPTCLEDALRFLETGDSTLLAGGTDVYPALRGRDLPGRIVDISGIAGLRGVSAANGTVRIGALTRWSDLRKPSLPPAFDGLRAAALQVGGPQIQNSGTIGGNICNASPAADGIPPLLTLDAQVELASPHGIRQVPLTDFVIGPRRTLRAADEVLTAVLVPSPPPDVRAAFEKLGARRYLVISIVMVATLLRLDARGRIAEARVAVGAASPVALRLTHLEQDLVGQAPDDVRIADGHLADLAPIDDPRGTAVYRREAVAELCRRAIAAAGGAHG